MNIPTPLQTLLRSLPPWALQSGAQATFDRVVKHHRGLFGRLGAHAAKCFVFAPTDVPFEFAVHPADGRVRVARPGRILRSDVRISAPLFLLLALAEGRVDGDAEFFGRQLSIDGDMEAVLALRNALEDCRIDFTEDMAPSSGPLRQPVRLALRAVRNAALAKRNATWS